MQGGRGVAWTAIESVPIREYRTLAHLRDEASHPKHPSPRYTVSNSADEASHRQTTERRLRRAEGYPILAAFAVMVANRLWPELVNAPVRDTLETFLGWPHARGISTWFGYDVVQLAANVELFVYLGVLVAPLGIERPWWASGIAAVFLSTTVDLIQAIAPKKRYDSAGLLATHCTR
jgi:hypothetical protein